MSLISLSTWSIFWVAHVILVSAQGPNPSFFLFWGTFIQFGPGLDNYGHFTQSHIVAYCEVLLSQTKYENNLICSHEGTSTPLTQTPVTSTPSQL